MTAGDTIGAYRVGTLLGAGGMGEVWRAEHVLLGRKVAIKLLRPELSGRPDIVERFFDEARAAARIDDPGIVAVHDFGRHGDSAYIVMEHLAGTSLSARLAGGRLAAAVAARLVAQAAMTMAVAHERGIVHRDLKPDNLFLAIDAAVAGGERVKILDFGIAKLVGDHDVASRTQTGALLGTPMYMSPEQCRNAGSVDHRTDIYALGCVLFHLACGRPPFVGESSGDLIAAHVVDPPAVPSSLVPGLPPALDAVVARCLAKSPSDRYATMTELVTALAPIAGMTIERPAVTPPADVGYLTTLGTGVGEAHAAPRASSRSWRILAAIVAVAAIATLVLVMRTGDGEPVSITPASGAMPPSPPAVKQQAITHEPPPPVTEPKPVTPKPRPKPRPRPDPNARDEGAYESR